MFEIIPTCNWYSKDGISQPFIETLGDVSTRHRLKLYRMRQNILQIAGSLRDLDPLIYRLNFQFLDKFRWFCFYCSRCYYDTMWRRITRLDFRSPKSMRFRCTQCSRCCQDSETRARHVVMLKNEATQIEVTVSKPIADFAQEITGHAPYVYEMKKTDGRCMFLAGNHCTIYAVRPLVCRFYPFELKTTENGKLQFSYTEECSGTGMGERLGRDFFLRLVQQANERIGADRCE